MLLQLALLAPAAASIPADVLCNSKLLAYDFAATLLPERAAKADGAMPPHPTPQLATTLTLWRAGLAAVALGLGVNPANKTCTTSGGGHGHGHGPSPPGPPPPPKPHVPHGSCSALMPGMSLVYGSRANSWPTTGSAAACEALCKANATCTYGTWHDEHQGRYKNACMLETDQRYSPHRQDGHTSFLCNMSATLQEAAAPEPDSVWWAAEARRLDRQPPRHRGWRASVPPLPTAEAGSTLYVDAAKGSDSAAGSLAAPLKTIQAAVDKLSSGGSVLLRAGTFFLKESVTISHSGITIAPYQSEEV